MPPTIRLIVLASSLVLVALIAWAIRTGDFGGAGDWLFSDPWGIVAMWDLYLGFILGAIIIAWTERSNLVRIFWILPIFVLGNVWTGLWFVLRGHKLYKALREAAKA